MYGLYSELKVQRAGRLELHSVIWSDLCGLRSELKVQRSGPVEIHSVI